MDLWEKKRHKNAVVHDRYDEKISEGAAKSSSLYSDSLARNTERLSTYPELLTDAFLALYKYSAETVGPEDMEPGYRVNNQLMKEGMNTGDYRMLRKNTRHDELAAAVGATVLAEEMAKQVPEETKSAAEEAQEAHDRAGDAAREYSESAEGEDGDDETVEKMRMRAEELAEKAGEAEERLQEAMENQASALAQGARKAVRQAEREVEETKDLAQAWGLGPGEAGKMPIEASLALLERIRGSERLKKLTKEIGREIRRALTQRRVMTTKTGAELHDLETGMDLERVLPSELAAMDDPVLGADFDRKLAEGALVQYKVKQKEVESKGPVVCCVDTSSSMRDENPLREIKAKACAMGIAEICKKEKRRFWGVVFSGETFSKEPQVETFEVTRGPAEAVAFAEKAFWGGTSFDHPLNEALRIIETDERKADIVFITDGQCRVSEEMVSRVEEQRKGRDLKIVGILVDQGWGGEELKRFCDEVILASEFSHDTGRYTEGVYRGI